MSEPEAIGIEEVPVWTAGWTAGYAAGIKRALADCPTHGVCPNCREGWGHYTHEHGYLPTAQSEREGIRCTCWLADDEPSPMHDPRNCPLYGDRRPA